MLLWTRGEVILILGVTRPCGDLPFYVVMRKVRRREVEYAEMTDV
jgi:hypothetical protein